MAIQSIYSIFDRKAAAYMAPFFSANKDTAIRSVQIQVTQNPPPHMADYDLYLIGEWDDNSGQLLPAPPLFLDTITNLYNLAFNELSNAQTPLTPEEQNQLLQDTYEDLDNG